MQIKFSHCYSKLWNQLKGLLLCVRVLDAKEVQENQSLLEYDTKYADPDDAGNEHHTDFEGDIEHRHYPLPKTGELIQLVFIGDKHIPFCTIRTRYHYDRQTKQKEDKILYYKALIGKWFNIVIESEGEDA